MYKIRIMDQPGNVGVVTTALTYDQFAKLGRGLTFIDQGPESSENAVWDPVNSVWINNIPVEEIAAAYETFKISPTE